MSKGDRMNRIGELLGSAQEAAKRMDWTKVAEVATAVLAVDPKNEKAIRFHALAQEARR